MQLVDGTIIVSATDLVGYLACDHLVTLELEAAAGDRVRPVRNDPELDLIRRRGFEHEAAHLAALRDEGRSIHEIETRDAKTPDELRAAEAETYAAMRAGRDVIFQATFFDGRWLGYADFLVRVEIGKIPERVHRRCRILFSLARMGRPTGLEPATLGTTNRCSNQLSYDRHSR